MIPLLFYTVINLFFLRKSFFLKLKRHKYCKKNVVSFKKENYMSSVDYLSAINTKGSGLNVTQIVDSLVEAETAPEKNSINKKIEEQTAAISALGEVVSELDSLNTLVKSFQNNTKLVTSSSNTSASLVVSDPSTAKTFESDINVTALATSQTLEFTGFNLPSASTGSGTITVDFGQWLSGASTDSESIYSKASVTSGTSLGTPISHSSLKGTISITSEGGNLSSTNFTVTGTDMAGNTITETITGPTLGSTTSGNKVFNTVTNIVPDNTVADGSVTVGHAAATFGSNSAKSSQTVNISSGATLNSVSNSLNAVEGISATIINKGDGTYSLLVRSNTGLNNALRLTVSEASGDAGLSTFDTTSDNANHQRTAAADAALTIDGVNISRSENSISDLFDGYNLNLSKTSSSSFRINSSLDKDNSFSVMNDFIDTINSTRAKLNELTRLGDGNSEEGPLRDNIAVKTTMNKINQIITGSIKGFGSEDLHLSRLGVTTNLDGTISVNETTFKTAIENDSTLFDSIFNSMFSSSSPYLDVKKSIGTSNPTPGSYAYSSKNFVTSLTANASPITPQTIEVSDASSIEVGDYIIGTGIPSETKVSSISGTTITLSNSIKGSTVITSGTNISFVNATLEGGKMTSRTGTDGVSYFVSSGSAKDTSGIQINSSQHVSSAFVRYGKSLVQTLSEFLESSLSSSGILKKSKLNENSKLNEFNEDLALIDDKVDVLTKRYRTQFTAMEQIVTSLKSTGDYMENMLNAWSKED